MAWILTTVMLLVTIGLPSTAFANGAGDFRVANYSIGFHNNNFLWRGYAFTVSRETVVTHLYGGGGPNCSAGFQGGIYEASWTGGSEGAGSPRLDTLLRGVVFNPTRDPGNPPQEEMVALSSPLTLYPGQTYFIAQGRVTTGSGCHYAANSIDVQNLVIGSPIIESWWPNFDAAYQPSGEGTAADAVGRIASMTTPVRVLVGFRYETDVDPPVFPADVGTGNALSTGPSTAIVEGLLADSGAASATDETTLYFEYSTSANFASGSSWLVPAQPHSVVGPATDVPFSRTLTGLSNGVTYYYRAVAINEGARTNANTRSFVHDGVNFAVTVGASVNGSGSVTPASRAVIPGETTSFQVTATGGHILSEVVAGTCPTAGGVWNGITYTTPVISEACSVVFSTIPPASGTVSIQQTDHADLDGSGTITPGDRLEYTISFTHTGGATIDDLDIPDSAQMDVLYDDCTDFTLIAGQSCQIIGTRYLTLGDAVEGQVTNAIVATASSMPVTLSDSVSTAVTTTLTITTAALSNQPSPTFSGTATLPAGSQVAISITDSTGQQASGHATVDGAGGFSFQHPSYALTFGTVSAQVSFVNNQGATFSANTTGSIDAVPIAWDVLSPSATYINDPRPTLVGTSNKPGALVTIRTNDPNAAPDAVVTVEADGSWQWTPPADYPDGWLVWYIEVVDTAGNEAGGSVSVKIITTAPEGTLVEPVDGLVTNNTQPTFSGTADEFAAVAIYVNDAQIGVVVVDASENWSFVPPTPFAEGIYQAQIVISDRAGNTSTDGPHQFEVDTTPPAVSIAAPAHQQVLTESPASITGTAEAGAQLSVSLDGEVLETLVVDASGEWQVAVPTVLTRGQYEIIVVATDAAQNTAQQEAIFTIVDVVAISAPSAGAHLNVTRPVLSGTAEPGDTLTVTIDGGASATVVVDENGNWTYTPGGDLSDGPREFVVEASHGPSASVTVIIDTVPPTLTVDGPGAYTNATPPTVYGTSEPGTTITIDTGVEVVTVTTDGNGNWQWTPSAALPDASYSWTVTATDEAGNETVEPLNFTVVTVDPQGSLEEPVAGLITNDQRPTFSGTADANTTVNVYVGGTLLGSTATAADGSWSFVPSSDLSEGVHVAHAVIVDQAGNSITTDSNQFEVDITPPAVAISAPEDDAYFDQSPVEISGTAEPGATVSVSLNGTVLATVTADSNGSWEVALGDELTRGPYLVEVTATDAATNATEVSSSFTVVDPVVITAPADGVHLAEPRPVFSGTGEPGDTLTLTIDGESFDVTVAGDGSWSYTPASDLSDGDYLVTVAGTHGESASVSITVDTVAPEGTITNPVADAALNDPAVTLTGTAEPGAYVDIVVNGEEVATVISDENGEWSFSFAEDLAEGDYEVVVHFRDEAGNTTSASVEFEVDITAPYVAIGQPADQSVHSVSPEVISGQAEAGVDVVVYINDTAVGVAVADENGQWEIVLDGELAHGEYEVRVTATDRAGNTSQATGEFAIIEGVRITSPQDGDIVRVARPTISGVGEPGDVVTVYLDGVELADVVVAADGSWSYTHDEDLLDNEEYTFHVEGGGDSADSVTFTVDTFTTDLVVTAPQDGAFINSPTPTFSGTAPAGAEITVEVNGEAVETIVADENGAWSWTSESLPDGEHTVVFYTVNEAGGALEESLTITIDTVPPHLSVTTPEEGAYINEEDVISGTAEPGSTVVVYVDGVAVGTTEADENGDWSLAVPEMEEGEYVLRVTATDRAGNTTVVERDFKFGVEFWSRGDITGGGGCSSTDGGPGSLFFFALLALVFALVRRPAVRRALAPVAVVAALFALPATAQAEGFDLQQFNPMPNQANDFFSTSSATVAPHMQWSVSMGLNYAQDPLVLRDAEGRRIERLVANQATTHLLFSLGLFERFELGLDLPFIALQSGADIPDGVVQPGQAGAGLGDVRLLPRVGLLNTRSEWETGMALALLVDTHIPTGDAHSLQGGDFRVAPRLAFDIDIIEGLLLAANLGYTFRGASELENLSINDTVNWNAAAEYTINQDLRLVGEVFGRMTPAAMDRTGSPTEFLAGGKYQFGQFLFSAGAGLGLVSGYGTPNWRGFMSVGFSPQGLRASTLGLSAARAEHEAALAAGLAAEQERAEAEARKLREAEERERQEAEALARAEQEEAERRAREEAEARARAEREAREREEAARRAAVDEERQQIELRETVVFATNSGAIDASSHALLNEVAQILEDNPQIGHIRIEGHTDSRGSRQHNMSLSQIRANNVKQYLVNQGIAAERISTAGLGPDRPVANNDSEDGRAQNRRVEIHIVENEN